MTIARTIRTLLVAGVFACVGTCPLAFAADLININTADQATLETLPGIGPAKAAAIIAYRAAHGPFATTAAIKNVSGIGDATYAQIAPLITVGDALPPPDDTGAPHEDTGTTTPAPVPVVGSPHTRPVTLTLDIGDDQQATPHTPVHFRAVVEGPAATDTYAQVTWSFGDGQTSEGFSADPVFDRPGTYVVAAHAKDGTAEARASVLVIVADAPVAIATLGPAGVTLANTSDNLLDLSGWMLVEGASNFRIPEDTWLAPGASVLFSHAVTGLMPGTAALLAYPDGTIAAAYPAAPPVTVPVVQRAIAVQQEAVPPLAAAAGSHVVQTVESSEASPAIASTNADTYAAMAPAGTAGVAALADPAPAWGGAGRLVHSPWAYGLLGVITLAGGAFFIL